MVDSENPAESVLLPALLLKTGMKEDILFGFILCVLSLFMIHQ